MKSGGILGFTDWIWGSNEAPISIADYLMEFMVFPDLQTLDGYEMLIKNIGMKLLDDGQIKKIGPAHI